MKGVPIKFRGKRVKDGKTVYGWAYKSDCPMSSFPAIIDYNDKYNAIYPESVAQLVGYDADGNEVYEGDKIYYYRCFCVSGDYIRQNKIPPAGVCTVISAHRLDGLYNVGLNDHFDYEFLLKKFNKEKD